MRVLVCPTAFKGSFGAAEAARAMGRGLRGARPEWEVEEVPLSDGGPGLLDALGAAAASRLERVEVPGPLGEPAVARILWLGGREAVLESADACGLDLMGERRAPLEAHTRGVGELVARAVAGGAEAVRVGLGGSASTDGGTGMARAFGWRFLDADGRDLPDGGGALSRLARIEQGRVPGAAARGAPVGSGASAARTGGPKPEITALADVRTPLLGMRGAARTFGPQKGADADEVERLVDGLERLAGRILEDLGPEAARAAEAPGSGAAGGLGAGMAVFLGARIVPGAAWVMERVGFAERLAGADAVVTGEGAWDRSSEAGKITAEVLRRASERGVPAALLCGRLASKPPACVRALDGGGARLDEEGLAALAARAARSLQEPGGAR